MIADDVWHDENYLDFVKLSPDSPTFSLSCSLKFLT